jgi:hypothetical protein
MMMSIAVENTRIAQWRMQRDVKVEKIKLLWAEIEKIRSQYSELGTLSAETDRVLQSIVYGLISGLPVIIPRSPKRYYLRCREHSEHEGHLQLSVCAMEFNRVLREIKKEWKWLDRQQFYNAMDEFLKEKCWRVYIEH